MPVFHAAAAKNAEPTVSGGSAEQRDESGSLDAEREETAEPVVTDDRSTLDGAMSATVPTAGLYPHERSWFEDSDLVPPTRAQLLPWLDVDTGETLRELTLESLVGEQPRLGPPFSVGERLFVFWGHDQWSPVRELLQLGSPETD